MKTPQEIIKWCDMMIGMRPNVGDLNYFNSIKAMAENIKMYGMAIKDLEENKRKAEKRENDL